MTEREPEVAPACPHVETVDVYGENWLAGEPGKPPRRHGKQCINCFHVAWGEWEERKDAQ